jgi:hypothetical protein
MKKMIMLAMLVSVQCLMASAETVITIPPIDAPQANPLWMVSSKDALTSYAISKVSQGSAQVWAPTSVEGQSFTNSVYCEIPFGERSDAFKVLDMIKQQQIYFSVVRPDVDQVNSYIGLYSSDGWCMFYGWGYGSLYKDDLGNWFPPDSLLKFDTYLGAIPVLSNVQQAKTVLRDKDGNIISIKWNNVENGQLIFSKDLAGQKGEIIVTMQDGSSIAASLNDNKVFQIIGVPAKLNASIDGVILFANNTESLKVNPQSYQGYGDSPLVRGTFTKMQWFTLSANTTEGEIPLGVWYRNVETSSVDEWKYLPVSSITTGAGNNTTSGNIDVPIDSAGTYEFRLEWENFKARPNDYYYYGEKG